MQVEFGARDPHRGGWTRTTENRFPFNDARADGTPAGSPALVQWDRVLLKVHQMGNIPATLAFTLRDRLNGSSYLHWTARHDLPRTVENPARVFPCTRSYRAQSQSLCRGLAFQQITEFRRGGIGSSSIGMCWYLSTVPRVCFCICESVTSGRRLVGMMLWTILGRYEEAWRC